MNFAATEATVPNPPNEDTVPASNAVSRAGPGSGGGVPITWGVCGATKGIAVTCIDAPAL